LEKALLNDYEITTVSRPFLEKYASLTESAEMHALLKPDHRQQLQEWLFGREIIDVIRQFPVRGLSAQEFIGLLRKLPPRLYSIASSWTADPDEVHLTVAVVRFESHSLSRNGVASTFLADRVEEGGTVPVYVHENPNFRLPRDSSTPIIMIGPGTGVAPFRAFLSEREALGAAGRNWLFFGDRNFETDFLYQNEWLDYRRKGLLTRIDVAFSRDGAEKVYVQHRIRQQARALYAWLQEGAHVYVCGDATQMAPDVQTALLEVVAQEGGKYPEQAQEYLHELQATKRYQRDVY
jgi:sulfite reductase (NADPH) flavoprotein alpha-component